PSTVFDDMNPISNRFEADPVGVMYFTNSNINISITPPPYFNHTISTGDDGYASVCGGASFVPTCTLGASSIDPSWLYFCGANGCKHRFYTIRNFTEATDKNNDGYPTNTSGMFCDKGIITYSYVSIGGDGGN